jgi:hypothetical protein
VSTYHLAKPSRHPLEYNLQRRFGPLINPVWYSIKSSGLQRNPFSILPWIYQPELRLFQTGTAFTLVWNLQNNILFCLTGLWHYKSSAPIQPSHQPITEGSLHNYLGIPFNQSLKNRRNLRNGPLITPVWYTTRSSGSQRNQVVDTHLLSTHQTPYRQSLHSYWNNLICQPYSKLCDNPNITTDRGNWKSCANQSFNLNANSAITTATSRWSILELSALSGNYQVEPRLLSTGTAINLGWRLHHNTSFCVNWYTTRSDGSQRNQVVDTHLLSTHITPLVISQTVWLLFSNLYLLQFLPYFSVWYTTRSSGSQRNQVGDTHLQRINNIIASNHSVFSNSMNTFGYYHPSLGPSSSSLQLSQLTTLSDTGQHHQEEGAHRRTRPLSTDISSDNINLTTAQTITPLPRDGVS